MDILISVTAKIAEYTVEPVLRQLRYVFFIRSNFCELKTQIEKLKITKESVEHNIHSARRNAEDIKPAVEEWSKKVDDIVGKSEEILAYEGGHGRLCSTNLVQRHKLSRKASKMAYEVRAMNTEGKSFDTVSYKIVIPSVGCSPTKVPDFLDFDSRKSIVKQIMDALSEDNVHRIGVHGMGGVGKTMLVNEILRKIGESKKLFDEVVTSTISQTPDFKRIQGELADKLGLKFEQETIKGRASILEKRLKMERSILVVLDDVWENIDLKDIGIPSVEDHTGCKILFTTRNKDLISNQMCANKIFEIKVLGEDESWNLFKTIAGEIVEARDLKPIAIQIVRECAGLPIAITTVAKALRNQSSDIWNDALNQLKSVDVGIANIGEMERRVYLPLKLSYDYLGYEEVKLLFLLCSMFPEDFTIDEEELHVYAIGMGFLHGVNTVEKVRCRIKKLVEDLISSSLLQQYSEYGRNYVKMHDMIRDVALSIASKNEHVRTLSYVKRSNEEWEEEKLSDGKEKNGMKEGKMPAFLNSSACDIFML
ncbi:probable disease resistance protein At5g63020 [Cucumis melo]|uniref:Probable disease resistance protein At5g63020 n=1 Tax=Cucumis melo TaxID=3656 RepID=A0ABM3KU61_CUCME|nr:probable disease resistance protein At5g63020 [Cucumis melo]